MTEEKYEERVVQREKCFMQQLQETEETFAKQLTEVFQRCMARAEELDLKQKELEHQLQESVRRREEEQRQRTAEIQRISQELCHLQVRCLNICFSFR